MSFLKEFGFNENDINKIISNNDSGVIKNIIMNQENVKGIIEYLNDLGVNEGAIKDLFIHQIGMFYRTKDEIKTVFDEYEIDSIVKSLNYDVNTVDLIEF